MKQLLLFFLLGFLLGCQGTTNEIYQIPLGDAIQHSAQLQAEECIDSIRYIQLQTVDSGFIGNISKIVPWKDYLYISDWEDHLYLFKQSGEFLCTIGSVGRGPGEYIGVGDLLVDPENGDLYVMSMNKMLVYGLDGQLKKEQTVDPRLQVGTFASSGHPVFISPVQQSKADTFPLLYVCDREGRIGQTVYGKNPHVALPMSFFNWIYEKEGEIYFKEEFSDTICRMGSELTPRPYAVVDLGGYAFKPQHFDFQYENDWENHYRLLGAWDFDQTMLLKVQQGLYGNTYTSFIYSKSTNKVGTLGDSQSQEGFVLDHVLYTPVSGQGKQLICWISSASLKDNERITGKELGDIAKDISLDANPVIAVLYMK